MANSVCGYCRKAIGYEVRFYQTDGGLVHAVCAEDAAEARAMPG
jgi:hypothetical protein